MLTTNKKYENLIVSEYRSPWSYLQVKDLSQLTNINVTTNCWYGIF